MDYILTQALEMVSTNCFPRYQVLCSALVLFIRKLGWTDCPAGVPALSSLQGWDTKCCVCYTPNTLVSSEWRRSLAVICGGPELLLTSSSCWGLANPINSKETPGPSPLHPWVAYSSMAEDPCWFCRSYSGPYVHGDGGSSLQMAWSHSMSSSTTSNTIQMLRGLLSRYRLPEVLVSDIGPSSHQPSLKLTWKAMECNTHWSWLCGSKREGVCAKTSPVSYAIYVGSLEHWKCHVDQLLAWHALLRLHTSNRQSHRLLL